MLKCKENRLRGWRGSGSAHSLSPQSWSEAGYQKASYLEEASKVLEEKECAEKAGVDTKILHTKKKVQKYKMTLRVNILTRILLP